MSDGMLFKGESKILDITENPSFELIEYQLALALIIINHHF